MKSCVFFKNRMSIPRGFFIRTLSLWAREKSASLTPVSRHACPYREGEELRRVFAPGDYRDAQWDVKANPIPSALPCIIWQPGLSLPLGRKEETAAAILKEEPLDPRYHQPEIGGALAGLLLALLAKEPAKRPGLQEFFDGIRELYHQDRFLATPGEKEHFAGEGERARRRLEQKRRAQRWWLKAKWPVVVGIPVLVLFHFFSQPAYEEVVTPETTPEEVVTYFYKGLAEVDHMLLEQTVTGEAGKEYIKLTVMLHVIAKARMAYEGVRFPFIIVEDLRIEPEEDAPAELRPSGAVSG